MIREKFLREIHRIEADLLSMGHVVQNALGEAVKALLKRDFTKSREIIANDALVNQRQHDIEMACLRLIATQQPMARDLRSLATVIAISSELERMHDYAKGIGKINVLLSQEPLMDQVSDLPIMATKAQDMLHRAMICFARRDVVLARTIPIDDDEVDALYNKIYHEVFTSAMEDMRWMTQANYILWAAHNIERTADRVTNICERVVFVVTGKLVEISDDNFAWGEEIFLPSPPVPVGSMK